MKKQVTLTKEEAEIIIKALSAAASDDMRFTAWDILDAKIKAAQ